MQKYSIQNKLFKKGFTLVELMVVVTIIGVLAVSTVPSYFRSQKNAKYENAVSEIISLFKETRNQAISGQFVLNGTVQTTPEGGYGVFIDKASTPQKIVSFIDNKPTTKGNQIFETTPVANMDTILATFTLPTEITITTMSGALTSDRTGTPTELNTAVVLFIPPQGDSYINENDNTKNLIDLNLVLKRYDNNKSKKLKINRISGFIEVE